MVFLVPASTDRISVAGDLRKLLTSAAGSLNTIGARDSQVLILSDWTLWWCAAHSFIVSWIFLLSGGRCSLWLQTKNMVPPQSP